MMWKIIILSLLVVIGPASAWAHPFTESTIPEKFSNAPTGINQIIVTYSEDVELDFSSLKVYDTGGVQIDKRDTAYYDGEHSLIVTTEPLEDGIYTITSKVLSQVDGHLVDYAFVFSVGDAKIDPELVNDEPQTSLIFYPEAAAIIPGYIGQTIVLGSLVMSIFVWTLHKKRSENDQLSEKYRGKFTSLLGIGLIAVLASNILVIAVHAFRLETGILDLLYNTTFGSTWILRFSITVTMIGLWFVMEKNSSMSKKNLIPMMILSLVLIATTTMTGHALANNSLLGVVLDYIHNLLAAVWIGGIFFLAFCMFPTLSSMPKAAIAALPRFSVIFIFALGIIIVTGPTLLWVFEENFDRVISSTYGILIAIKIFVASIMVIFGAFVQFSVQKHIRMKKWNVSNTYKKLHRSLRIEAILGCILLVVVALLVNGTLPAGETPTVENNQNVLYGKQITQFVGDLQFYVDIFPFTSGTNTISASVTNLDGNSVDDLSGIKLKISNPQKGIAPILLEQNSQNLDRFDAEATFGFAGKWQLDVEAQRTEHANEAISLLLDIKPRLNAIKTDIVEFDLPNVSQPLHVIYGSDKNIWISDPTTPRIWQFLTDDEKFVEHVLPGSSSITLEEDKNGLIWFTDIGESSIGSLDPQNGLVQTYLLPPLYPLTQNNFPISLESYDEMIWVTVINKNTILKLDPKSESWEEFILPTENSGPFSIKADATGKLWFTQQTTGGLGFIDITTGQITEIPLQESLIVPETLTIDEDGTIWIAEHGSMGGIAAYNPTFETLKKITSPIPSALANSAVFDKYGNIWFAQHTVDSLAVYDPQSEEIMTVSLPTNQSWVQFLAADDDGNIWFAEQKPNKLGKLTVSEGVSSSVIPQRQSSENIHLALVAGPLMAAGLIATSLFFVKTLREKREIDLHFKDELS